MSKFLLRIFILIAMVYCCGEIIVRVYRLTPDIPRRLIDNSGIQRYKPGQSGYYAKSDHKWNVNDFGWLGVAEINYDKTIGIIGDSYIENIMNPIDCNQGTQLKQYVDNVGFFEAGRSGVSFIEAMEITKMLDTLISTEYNLIYVSSNDFYESFSSNKRYKDRIQVDLQKESILKAKMKAPKLKNLIYNFKLIYYLYLRFPLFVNQENKNVIQTTKVNNGFDFVKFSGLFEFCKKNYNFEKNILVFHPGTEEEIIEISKNNGFKVIELNSEGDKSWVLGKHEGHWSCYGHTQVAKQVQAYLKPLIK